MPVELSGLLDTFSDVGDFVGRQVSKVSEPVSDALQSNVVGRMFSRGMDATVGLVGSVGRGDLTGGISGLLPGKLDDMAEAGLDTIGFNAIGNGVLAGLTGGISLMAQAGYTGLDALGATDIGGRMVARTLNSTTPVSYDPADPDYATDAQVVAESNGQFKSVQDLRNYRAGMARAGASANAAANAAQSEAYARSASAAKALGTAQSRNLATSQAGLNARLLQERLEKEDAAKHKKYMVVGLAAVAALLVVKKVVR